MKCRWLVAVLAVLVVAACSPVYQTDYRFSTPPTPEGKICANSCLDKLNSCTANCRAAEAECRHIQSLEAENAYLRYVNEQQKENKPIEKTERSFVNYSACDSGCEDLCYYTQRICHVNCGGNVTEHKYCSAFCE